MDALSPSGEALSPHTVVAAAQAGLAAIRARRPRIHCITNSVAQAYTANALLAIGAIPSMTTSPDEIAAFAGSADGLLVNLGTLEPERLAVIATAIDAAEEAGRPWLLDPVFVDRSPPRAAFAREIAARRPTVIRGNAAEIAALAPGEGPAALAARLGTVVAVTGEADRVTDGAKGFAIANGHPLMARVTAMGCAGTAITTAFLSVGATPLVATAAALAVLGLAGEVAARTAAGPGSFAIAYLDALDALTPDALAEGACIKVLTPGDAS